MQDGQRAGQFFIWQKKLAPIFMKSFRRISILQMIITMLLGVIFIIVGNYLPKTKQTYTVGIRIPWTLDNEDNWNKTHRLAGFIWVVGGVAVFVSSLTELRVWIIAMCIAVMVIVPIVYSFLYYIKNK